MTASDDVTVRFGTATAADMEQAARIYVDYFSERLTRVCGSDSGARRFCVDLMELMRLFYGRTFFTAHDADGLIGYLILIVPGRRVLSGMFRHGFIFRAAAKLLGGRYGSPFGILGRVIARSLGRSEEGEPEDLKPYPHVYVVAVSGAARGRGVGARLLGLARAAVEDEFPKLWLSVDIDNQSAVRFYERLGMTTVARGTSQQHMVWPFKATGGAVE